MALPLAFLAALLSGGSVVANKIGANKADRAQADVMRSERRRRDDALQQSYATNEAAARRYENLDEKRAETTLTLADMFAPGDMSPPSAMPASSDNVTVRQEEQADEEGKAFNEQQAGARAKVLSLSDLFTGIRRGVGRDAESLDQTGRFMRGSQDVLATELDAASQAGQGWRVAGDIMGGLGSAATMGALSGAQLPGFLGGGAAASTAATSLRPRPRPKGSVSLHG